MNLMANDTEQLMWSPVFVCMAVMSVMQLFIYTGLLLWLMGWAALAGVGVLLVTLPVIGKLSGMQQVRPRGLPAA